MATRCAVAGSGATALRPRPWRPAPGQVGWGPGQGALQERWRVRGTGWTTTLAGAAPAPRRVLVVEIWAGPRHGTGYSVWVVDGAVGQLPRDFDGLVSARRDALRRVAAIGGRRERGRWVCDVLEGVMPAGYEKPEKVLAPHLEIGPY